MRGWPLKPKEPEPLPIKPENQRLYPDDWKDISLARREAAGWRCEGSDAYPGCRAKHGFQHPVTESIVVLTVAHLDHDPANCDPANLRAWCQRCHLTYDAKHHAETARRTRHEKRALGDLFDAAQA